MKIQCHMQKQPLAVKASKHRNSVAHSPRSPPTSATSLKKKIKNIPENIVIRNNLCYYDFNEIKWAKIVHYLLESNDVIKKDYLTPENIRTKDVLLCAKQRQLLRGYNHTMQSTTKILEASKGPEATPNIFIPTHRHFFVQRDRLLRQLQQARFKRQLSPKQSQCSFPFVLNCRTGTNADLILDQEEIDGTPPQKSRHSNFDALIGNTLDTTKKQEGKDFMQRNFRQTPLRVKPFRCGQFLSANSRKTSPSLNRQPKKKSTSRKKHQRKNIRPDNPYQIVPTVKKPKIKQRSKSKSRSNSKNPAASALVNEYRLIQRNIQEKYLVKSNHRYSLEQL